MQFLAEAECIAQKKSYVVIGIASHDVYSSGDVSDAAMRQIGANQQICLL
jgi:hypothetical protein